MHAKYLLLIILFGLISCSQSPTDYPDYEVYFWRAFYNPEQDPNADYTVKMEIDTVVNHSPVHLNPTDARFILYQKLDSLKTDSKPQLTSFGTDSLLVLSDMTKAVWYDREFGTLKILFPHSRNPGALRSYELEKIIQYHKGARKVVSFENQLAAIDELLEEERQKFDELFQKLNNKQKHE